MSMVIYQSYFLVFSTDTSAHTVRSILERLTDLCKHEGRFSVRLKLFYNILEQFSTRTVLKIDVTQLSLIFFLYVVYQYVPLLFREFGIGPKFVRLIGIYTNRDSELNINLRSGESPLYFYGTTL